MEAGRSTVSRKVRRAATPATSPRMRWGRVREVRSAPGPGGHRAESARVILLGSGPRGVVLGCSVHRRTVSGLPYGRARLPASRFDLGARSSLEGRSDRGAGACRRPAARRWWGLSKGVVAWLLAHPGLWSHIIGVLAVFGGPSARDGFPPTTGHAVPGTRAAGGFGARPPLCPRRGPPHRRRTDRAHSPPGPASVGSRRRAPRRPVGVDRASPDPGLPRIGHDDVTRRGPIGPVDLMP